MNEIERLETLLEIERRAHARTRQRLEKADHDRQRYAKRIHFLQARHEVFANVYRALRKERDILDNCVSILERRLEHESSGSAAGGTGTAPRNGTQKA